MHGHICGLNSMRMNLSCRTRSHSRLGIDYTVPLTFGCGISGARLPRQERQWGGDFTLNTLTCSSMEYPESMLVYILKSLLFVVFSLSVARFAW